MGLGLKVLKRVGQDWKFRAKTKPLNTRLGFCICRLSVSADAATLSTGYACTARTAPGDAKTARRVQVREAPVGQLVAMESFGDRLGTLQYSDCALGTCLLERIASNNSESPRCLVARECGRVIVESCDSCRLLSSGYGGHGYFITAGNKLDKPMPMPGWSVIQ